MLSTVVAKDAVSSVHVQSDSEYRLFEVVSRLGRWLKTCPEDLAKHTGAFFSWLLGEPLFFYLSSRLASQAHLPLGELELGA